MDLVQQFSKAQVVAVDRPDLRTGDIVQVETKVIEGGKTRLQKFEGTVINVRGAGASKTITVRRESAQYGVERIFQLYSPIITNIEIVKRQKVRRSKLNYLRQAGRRRVKEDVLNMQRHMQLEKDKTRLAEEKKKREAEKAEKQAQAEAKKAEVASAEKPAETPEKE